MRLAFEIVGNDDGFFAIIDGCTYIPKRGDVITVHRDGAESSIGGTVGDVRHFYDKNKRGEIAAVIAINPHEYSYRCPPPT